MYSYPLHNAVKVNHSDHWMSPSYQPQTSPSFLNNVPNTVVLSPSVNFGSPNSTDTSEDCESLKKRERILERNRQAASRCRQKKKECLAQLKSQVHTLSKENIALEHTTLRLREEILNLKTILLAHRHCSQAGNINFDQLLCPT